jgi:hypothetical protein
MGKSSGGGVLPPNTPVTFCMTLTLAEANNLLVALANAINNAGSKGKGKKGGGTKGGGKGAPKGGHTGGSKTKPKGK